MTMTPLEFVVLALACYRLTRLVLEDEIVAPLRERIWRRYSPTSGNNIGYLITCPWCTSIWVGSLLVVMYKIAPEPAFYVSCAFALSAIAGLIDRAS
jgi:hypothetical protein